jgi:hypothetical protein
MANLFSIGGNDFSLVRKHQESKGHWPGPVSYDYLLGDASSEEYSYLKGDA